MKICFVVQTFDKRDRGGVLRVVSQLANQLVNTCMVEIISFGAIGEESYELDERIQLTSLNLLKYNTSYYKGIKKIYWFKEAYDCIKSKISLDTIWITSSPPISLLFSWFKMQDENLKVIGCDHTSTLYRKNPLMQFFRNFLLSKLNIMVALTPQDQKYYSSKKINSICIPNGINLKNIPQVRNERKYLIFVGRLNEEKQPFKAIDFYAASDLSERNIKMKIYGHGDFENEVKSYILKKNLENTVKVVNGETDPNVIYSDAFALILTSKVEGFGLVLLEAMSRNIPCLSFKTPYGPLNIIKEGVNGYFFEEDFQEKINLLDHLKLNIISNSICEYDVNVIEDIWVELLKSLYES